MRAQAEQPGGQASVRTNRGFSLIELLIVVAVILTIAAIAIPNFIRSKMKANEAGAVQNLRNVFTASVVYSTTYNIGFAATLAALGPTPGNPLQVSSTHAGLIDDVLAAGVKGGYAFTYQATDVDGDGKMDIYTVQADPLNPGVTGQRHYFTDQTGVIRYNDTAAASATDPPIS